MPPSDTATPPPEFVGFGSEPPDAETIARAEAGVQAQLGAINVHDPQSVFYQRPDLADQYRADLEAKFAVIRDRYGVAAPVAPTPEQRRAAAFAEEWPEDAIDPRWREAIGEQVAAEAALPQHERQQRERDLRKELGDEFSQLVEQARATLKAGETLPPAAFTSRFVLLNLAAAGRYQTARAAARAAAGLS